MAAIIAATVTGDNRFGGKMGMPDGKRKRNMVQITFGDGASTYPALGIPMPAKGAFGMVRFVERLSLDSPSPGDGFMYKWDSVNNTIRIYQGAGAAGPGVEVTTAYVPANNTTLYGSALGW